MSIRGRLVALAVVVALLLGGLVVLLLRSRTPDCGSAAPRPSLSPALRALGDFEQAYNAADPMALEDAAERAASAEYPALIGTSPEPPVAIVAIAPGSPDALVVPLRGRQQSGQGLSPLAGLVVFYRDCLGSAFFNIVENDAGSPIAPSRFPSVDRSQAAAQLMTADIRLTYDLSPLQPQWTTVRPPQRSIPGR